jgi:hypothetical protein
MTNKPDITETLKGRLLDALKGGPGSGNYGHAGRPGNRGGSAPKSGIGAAMSVRTGRTAAERQQAARKKPEGKMTGNGNFGTTGGATPSQIEYAKKLISHTNISIAESVIRNYFGVDGDRNLAEKVSNEANLWADSVVPEKMTKDGSSKFISIMKDGGILTAMAMADGINKNGGAIYKDKNEALSVAKFFQKISGIKIFVGSKSRPDGVKIFRLSIADRRDENSAYTWE